MSLWANVILGNCLSGQISFCVNVFWANVFLGKCLSGQMSSGQISFWANVFRANVVWANVFWANVVWANVLLRKRRMGKCILANVSGQTSYGKRHGTVY
jgi:hypothetical protein